MLVPTLCVRVANEHRHRRRAAEPVLLRTADGQRPSRIRWRRQCPELPARGVKDSASFAAFPAATVLGRLARCPVSARASLWVPQSPDSTSHWVEGNIAIYFVHVDVGDTLLQADALLDATRQV